LSIVAIRLTVNVMLRIMSVSTFKTNKGRYQVILPA
jgi:hypothetical protein